VQNVIRLPQTDNVLKTNMYHESIIRTEVKRLGHEVVRMKGQVTRLHLIPNIISRQMILTNDLDTFKILPHETKN
jgi:hypothetical protein